MDLHKIIDKAEKKVFGVFKENGNSQLVFHNYNHTVDVVKQVKEICKGLKIDDTSASLVILAAWFHDIGYLQKRDGHESIGADEATKFLEKEGLDTQSIEVVKHCILSTAKTKEPNGILEEVLKDADTLNIGTEEYKLRSNLLRLENSFIDGMSLEEKEWMENEIRFLKEHKYYTPFAQLNYNDGKSVNLLGRVSELKKLIKKAESGADKIKKANGKENLPQRGVETMFRTTLRNHINLSAIADNKANIMLSINAIIISVVISAVVPNFASMTHMAMPIGFLLLVCLASIVLATVSTRPKLIGGTFSKEDVLNKKANLLFFGNFSNTKLDYFEWGMTEMMKDKEFLYGAMIRDLHALGGVLQRKYKYLSWTYLTFMYGMIAAVLFFAVTVAVM